jgi:hypothetical protein
MSLHPVEALLRPPVELWSALVALGRRPDYQQIRRYINDIEPLFVEYAREHLRRFGQENWTTEVEEIAGKISERNLSAALKGRERDAIALMRYLQAQDLYDPAHEAPALTQNRVPTISMHADEFNELIGEEFVPLLNKAGGAGFQVTAYTQTWSDVEAKIGSRAKAGQVAGYFNTMIMLRVKELATAEMLTDQLPRVEVFTLIDVSGVNDSSDPLSGIDFQSRNEDRISVSELPMLTPAELVALPKGQAFALLEGGQPCVLFEFTGLVDLIAWVSAPPALDESGLRPRLHSIYEPVAEFVICGYAGHPGLFCALGYHDVGNAGLCALQSRGASRRFR